jgi:galactokinase
MKNFFMSMILVGSLCGLVGCDKEAKIEYIEVPVEKIVEVEVPVECDHTEYEERIEELNKQVEELENQIKELEDAKEEELVDNNNDDSSDVWIDESGNIRYTEGREQTSNRDNSKVYGTFGHSDKYDAFYHNYKDCPFIEDKDSYEVEYEEVMDRRACKCVYQGQFWNN